MSKDTVYRQDAIDALRYAQHRFTVADEAGGMGTVKWSEDVIYFAAAERVLTELPSAQPERKKGEWIWCGNHHICSECDEWALTRWDEDKCDEVDILTDFCPNCGADMRGEEHDK